MAHFALVNNGVVKKLHVVSNEVIIDDQGFEQETLGQIFLADLHGYKPDELVQCSYNGNRRGHFPAPGFFYDNKRDVFLPPKPFDSWLLDEETFSWVSPIPMPEGDWKWDEETGAWVEG